MSVYDEIDRQRGELDDGIILSRLDDYEWHATGQALGRTCRRTRFAADRLLAAGAIEVRRVVTGRRPRIEYRRLAQ